MLKEIQYNSDLISFIEQAPIAICLLDNDMCYIAASIKWKEEYSLQDKNINGISHYELFPEIGNEWKSYHQRTLHGEFFKSDEEKFIRLDGTIQWLRWEIAPWYVDGSKIGGIIIFNEDITYQKEQSLLIENFFDISTELFCIADFEGNFIKINNSWSELLGYSKEELYSKKFFEFMHPEDLQVVYKAMEVLYLGEKVFNFIVRFITKKNEILILKWNCNTINGQINAFGTNITNEITYINELKNTKEILEETNKIARIGYWEIDLIKNEIFWSQITKEIYGVDEYYNPNLKIAANFYKEGYSRNKINEVVNEAIINGTPYDLELEFVNFQEQELWVRVIGNVEFKDGKAVRLYGTLQDINERKILEIELAEDRKRLNQILEATNAGTWEWNVQTGETIFNERWAEIIGYKLSELEPIDINTWVRFAHPEDLEKSSEILNSHFAGQIDYYETKSRMKHKDGYWVWVLVRGKVFTWADDSKPLMMYGTHQEITKEVELQHEITVLNQNLISILDSTTQVSIIVTNLDGIITHFNKGAENLLGYKAIDMIGLSSPAILHVEEEIINSAEEIFNEYNENVEGFEVLVFKAKKGEYDIKEWTYVKKNGMQFKVQLIITSQKNSLGEIIGYIGVASDITKLKEYEVELIKAKEKAEKTSRAKSEFLANMSHEIRTPLNGVIGFTDLLMNTELDNLQRQYMDSVNKSATTLMDLINDILDFSKIESGKLFLNIEKIDLYDLVSKVVDVIKFKAYEKQLEVLLDLDYTIGRFIYSDPVRLRQILINLMDNAVKFTEKGEVSLSIKNINSVEGTDEFGNKSNFINIRFSIKDTGIGIENSKFGQILESFEQEDTTTTRKYGGTGLGLSITNKLLLLMDSQIEISSEIGIGSDFCFVVKVKVEDGFKEELVNETNYTNALVIDDNKYNRTIIKDMLKLLSINCDESEDGIDGLKNISKNHYDFIIIDYNMPHIDGIEVIKNIREKFNLDSRKQPIIFLHSSSDNEVIDNACKQYQVNYSMMKPINLDWLIKSINLIYHNRDGIMVNTAKSDNDDLSHNVFSVSKTYKILIVEDNDVNMLLVKSIFNLVMNNCEVFEARNGEEAIEKTKLVKPDIIFMDIQMPIMNGYDSTREIRQLEVGADIPIIALTAGTIKGERERCLEAGMSDYITKPVISNNIQEMLVKWLSGEKMDSMQIIKNETKNMSFDKNALMERVYDNQEAFEMIVTMMTEFLSDEFPKEFERSLIENDKTGYQFIVHKLKGSASSCCMVNLYYLSVELEKNDSLEGVNFEELKTRTLKEIETCITLLNKEL